MHAAVLFSHFSRVEVAVSAFVLLLEYSGDNSPGSSVRSACGGHLTRGPQNIVFQCAAAVDALLHGRAACVFGLPPQPAVAVDTLLHGRADILFLVLF